MTINHRLITMKMKYLSVIICVIFSAAYLKAEILPESMEKFHEASMLLINGINDADELPLIDAAEIFGSIELSDYTEFSFDKDHEKAISLPTIVFDSEFCDKLRIAKFDLVKMDKLETLRGDGINSDLLVINRDIEPGAEATLTFNGSDLMSILFIASQPGALTYKVSAEGKDIPVGSLADEYSAFTSWTMSDESSPIDISVNNRADRPVSFAIVFE